MTGFNKPASRGTRERCPDLAEIIDEDPARWLDRALIDDEAARELVKSRIRGLEDVNTVNVWAAAEKRIERGPRQGVLDWLDERRDELAEMGRMDFQTWLDEQPKRDPKPTESVARWVYEPDHEGGEVEVTDGSDRGPFVSSELGFSEGYRRRWGDDEPDPSPSATDDGPAEHPVATDGGKHGR